jgi:hypothetical protein
MPLAGVLGRAFVDLEPFLDASPLAALHEEICVGLTMSSEVEYTGGSHRSMGIVPATRRDERFGDYGEVLRSMSRESWAVLTALADDDVEFPDFDARDDHEFGEERDVPLSQRQLVWLKLRFGVYFPWQTYLELMPGGRWDSKHDPRGKRFTREATQLFPRTIAFVQSLPFKSIGSVKLLGLEANHHGTVHRDGDPVVKTNVDHFVTFCPAGDKRLFVWDETSGVESFAPSRLYWFNDSDWHGVAADPYFRYSVRVDGVFRPEFLDRLRDRAGA